MTTRSRTPQSANSREARLKSALRANLARRKAQGRARADEPQPAPEDEQNRQQRPPNGPTPQNED